MLEVSLFRSQVSVHLISVSSACYGASPSRGEEVQRRVEGASVL